MYSYLYISIQSRIMQLVTQKRGEIPFVWVARLNVNKEEILCLGAFCRLRDRLMFVFQIIYSSGIHEVCLQSKNQHT